MPVCVYCCTCKCQEYDEPREGRNVCSHFEKLFALLCLQHTYVVIHQRDFYRWSAVSDYNAALTTDGGTLRVADDR